MRRIVLSVLIAFIFGCSSHSSALPPVGASSVTPFVVQDGSSGGWVTFVESNAQTLRDSVVGHDGRVWMPDQSLNALVAVDMSGQSTVYPIGGTQLTRITTNPDGNLYVPEVFNFGGTLAEGIAQVDTSGVVFNNFRLPSGVGVDTLTSGSDGNIWFIYGPGNVIGRMTPNGVFTEFGLPSNLRLWGNISRGPDKNLWTAAIQYGGGPFYLVRISVADGSTTLYETPGDVVVSGPIDGGDGALWSVANGLLLRFDPLSQTFQTFALSDTTTSVSFLTLGANRRLYWCANDGHAGFCGAGSRIDSFAIKTHLALKAHRVPNRDAVGDLVRGPDGQIWADDRNIVNVLITQPIVTKPGSIVVSVGAQAPLSVKEVRQPRAKFTAVSNNQSIATVSGGPTSFTVTGVAHGNTTIILSDKIGNSLDVSVTVN